MDCYLKIVQSMITSPNMLLPSRIYIAGPLVLCRFSQHLSSIGNDQKKSHHLSSGPLAGTVTYCGKSGPILHNDHKKVR